MSVIKKKLDLTKNRKIIFLALMSLLCHFIYVILATLRCQTPVTTHNILGTVCRDTTTSKNDTTWFYNGNGSCETVDLANINQSFTETDVVFAFEIPFPRESMIFDYLTWLNNLNGAIQVDIRYHSHMKVKPRNILTIDARIAYRNKGDPDDEWKYTNSVEKRQLDCVIDIKTKENLYNCLAIPLFELALLNHDYYLLNLRLPVDTPEMNANIVNIQDMWITIKNQNNGFIKLWLSLKTVFFPFIIGIMIWFCRRVYMLQRKPVPLEKMLMCLGSTSCILNMPLEYLTFRDDLPYMSLLEDMKLGAFHVTSCSFMLIIAGEQRKLVQNVASKNLLKHMRNLIAVAMGDLSLFILYFCENDVLLRNPFYSVSVTDIGKNYAFTFIVLAGLISCIYFLFLMYKICQTANTFYKRASLILRGPIKNLHYESIDYEFLYIQLVSLLLVAPTAIYFFVGQLAEVQSKLNEHIEWEYISTFYTGLYVLWNIYIFVLLVLYAPRQNGGPIADNTSDSQKLGKKIKFSHFPSDGAASKI